MQVLCDLRAVFKNATIKIQRNLSRGFSFIIKNMNEQNYLIVSDNIGIIKYINIKI